MKARTRTRTRTSSQGSLWRRGNPPTVYGPWPVKTTGWECKDFIQKTKREDGSTPPSDLSLFKQEHQPLSYDYRLVSNIDDITYDIATSLPCLTFGDGLGFISPATWLELEGSDAQLTSKLLANTNPFRYKVSVPIMAVELLEAATLFKIALNNLFTIVGSQHLNYVFGWKQMIRDVRQLAKITTEIEHRIKEFNSLIKKGGLRRKIKLASGSKSFVSGSATVWSTHGLSFLGHYECTVKTKVWGSVRWKPARGKEIELSKLSAFNEATKIVFDLKTPDYSTIWEMIPFSWLVDYFLNVGDTLQAIENTDLVLPYDICIMKHRTCVTSTIGDSRSSTDYYYRRYITSSPGRITWEHKSRKVITITGVSSLLSFGFMSEGQSANLLALLLSLARFRK